MNLNFLKNFVNKYIKKRILIFNILVNMWIKTIKMNDIKNYHTKVNLYLIDYT